MDDRSSYPMLLGVDFAMPINAVINLKDMEMAFETKSLRVVIPLNQEGGIHCDIGLENIY